MTEQEAAMNRAYANALYRQRKAAEQAYDSAVWGGALEELTRIAPHGGSHYNENNHADRPELEEVLTAALLAVDRVPAACIHLRARARRVTTTTPLLSVSEYDLDDLRSPKARAKRKAGRSSETRKRPQP